MNTNHTNATAGPSSHTSLFFPPWQLPQHPPTHLRATHDLISRLDLLNAYDKHVRPTAVPVSAQPVSDTAPPSSPTPSVTLMDKGKGKERRNSIASAVMDAPTPGGPDGTDEDGKGEKRRKNTYRHLIKGTPGKHSTKKDDYLVMSVSIPPKPKLVIEEFDQRTQEKTFKMTLEGLKGWNIGTLVAETPQAKEEKRKRKEARKLQKANGPLTPGVGVSPSVGGNFAIPSTPMSATTPSYRPPGTPRISGIVVNNIPSRAATPRASAPPTPAATVSPAFGFGPGSAAPTPPPPQMSHPLPPRPSHAQDSMRGKKRDRDREEPNPSSNGHPTPSTPMNGTNYSHGPALAGLPNARPRPVKKQKVELLA